MNKKITAAFLMMIMILAVGLTSCGSSGDADKHSDDKGSVTEDLKDGADDAGDAVKDGAKDVKDGAEDIGNDIKNGMKDAGDKMKDGAEDADRDIKSDADKDKAN